MIEQKRLQSQPHICTVPEEQKEKGLLLDEEAELQRQYEIFRRKGWVQDDLATPSVI